MAPWYVAGPLLGLLIVGLRAAVNKPFGAFGGYIDLTAKRFGLTTCMLLGFALGGAVHAAVAGTWAMSFAYPDGALVPMSPAFQVPFLLLAGISIGAGARMAGGCTSGHGLNGTSLGSPASLVAAATFFATAVLVAGLFA